MHLLGLYCTTTEYGYCTEYLCTVTLQTTHMRLPGVIPAGHISGGCMHVRVTQFTASKSGFHGTGSGSGSDLLEFMTTSPSTCCNNPNVTNHFILVVSRPHLLFY